MNNSYSFKDILFGLRDEYLLLQQQLDTLKKYINLEENNLEDISFYLSHQYSEDEVKMLCTLYDKKSKIEKKLEWIKIQLGIYPKYRSSYINENNGEYVIEKYPEIIDKDKKQEFNQSVFYIFNTEFVKNVRYINSGTGYNDIPFLSLHPSYIYLSQNKYASLEFNPCKGDYISLYSFRGLLSKDKMENMFNMEFSKERFPEYYQNLIENSSYIDKPVDIVGDFGYSKRGFFEIIDESKRLVLRKK